jgi:hypothetical protein
MVLCRKAHLRKRPTRPPRKYCSEVRQRGSALETAAALFFAISRSSSPAENWRALNKDAFEQREH